MTQRFQNAWHNIIVHPLAGLAWLLGFDKLGDKLHDLNIRERVAPHWHNATYLFWHKLYVVMAGIKLGVPWPRLLFHDLSKFTVTEWSPYAKFFRGKPAESKNKQKSIDWKFKQAWFAHVSRNDHHPEYWTRPGQVGKKIHDSVLREMVADWFAAGRAQGKKEKNELLVWFQANRDRIARLIGAENVSRISKYVDKLTDWQPWW